jgi:tight adherence protein B
MQKDGAALLLLGWSLLLALAGCVTLVRGSSRRAALAQRGSLRDDEAFGQRAARALDRVLRRTLWGRRLAGWLGSTGVSVRAADFLLLCFAAALALIVVYGFVFSRTVAVIAAVATVAGVARSWGERRRAARREAFIAQLPDLARMLSNGASAGLSLAGAIELAAREMPDPAAEEMRSVVEQMRLGQPVDAALEALRERLPSREISVLMSTLVIQHRAGGDTVRALQELGSTLEARKDLLREIRTLMAGSVFNSWIVAGLGVGSLIMVNGIQPGLLRKMTSEPLGLVVLVVAASLYALALFLIRRTTRVQT